MVTRAMATTGIEARGSTWDEFCKRSLGLCEARSHSYFADGSMERKTPISCERPYHTRCGGEEPDDRTPGESDYDRNHHCSSGFRFDSIVEHLNEREAGG